MSSQNHISPRPQLYGAATSLSHLTSGVDSRTGNFQASVVLGTVVSGLQEPAAFSLTLLLGTAAHLTSRLISGASSQNAIEFGFNIPRLVIDAENPVLSKIYFASGEVDELIYNVTQNTLTPRYHKTNNIQIERYHHTADTRLTRGYKISYKDGRIEYYNSEGRITHLYSASGAGLWFEYGDGLIPLQKVRNEDNSNYIEWSAQDLPAGNLGDKLVTVTQMMDGVSTVIQYDLKCRVESTTPFNQIYYISRVSMPNDLERWITFEYQKPPSLDYYVLSGVITPMGLYKVVAQFGTRQLSQETHYPVVERVQEQNIFGFRVNTYDIAEIDYDYSADKNCTGYASDSTPVAGIDNCIQRTDDYRYCCWERYSDRTIKRTYNRFHLLVEEVVTAQPETLNTFITTTYTYPLVSGNIDRQPANFSLWTHKSIRYTQGTSSRTVSETRQFDVYGNLLSETQNSGIKQTHFYYPSHSTERQGCPPSPLFIRHLKKTIITPDSSAEHRAPAKTLEYTYTQINGRAHTNPITGELTSSYMTLPLKEKTNGLTIRENAYRTTLDTPLLLGVLISSRTSSPGFINTKQYSWTLDARRVTVSTSHVVQMLVTTGNRRRAGAAPEIASGGSMTYSPSSGRVHQETSPFGAITQYVYNDKGLLIQKTSFAGTPQEETQTYQFTYWTAPFKDNPDTDNTENTIWANVLTTRHSAGMVKYDFLNRNGLPLYEGYAVTGGLDGEIGDLDFSRISRQVLYDRSGPTPLIAADVSYDFLEGDEDGPSITEITEFKYLLGQRVQTVHPNRDTDDITYDFAQTPPAIRKSSLSSDQVYRERYDKYGKIIDEFVLFPTAPDAVETCLRQNIQDGLGRLVMSLNAFDQHFRHFELDTFDRVTSSRFDHDVTIYEYSTHLPIMDMPVRVKGTVNGTTAIVATRTFDGFGRMITQAAPGADTVTQTVTERYAYESNTAEEPSVITLNSGRIDNRYDPLTRALLSSSNTGIANADTTYAYVFDPVTKQLQSSTGTASGQLWCTHTYSHNVFGALIGEYRTYTQGQNVLRVSTAKTYSVFCSRLKSMELSHGLNSVLASVQYQYDGIGRVKQLDYQLGAFGTVKAEIVYNQVASGLGNISLITLSVDRLPAPGLKMTLDIEYASSGFERRRTYAINQTTVLQYGEQHFNSGRLSSTDTTRPPGAATTRDYGYKNQSLGISAAAPADSVGETQYTTQGFFRLNTITAPTTVSTYGYQSDRVQTVTHTTLTGAPLSRQRYDYNSNGSVCKVNDVETLTYNASHQLTQFSTTATPTPSTQYQYFYNPEGQLAQVVSENESVTYIYDDGVLTGEISLIGTTRVETLYLWANGVLLGRYIKKAATQALELFGVDPSGTVLFAYTYSDQGVELRREHYDYTDFGERSLRS
ncbi:hypothetical protein [Pseudomonas koreensis]|uniref:hypothetical protein n=1 Tax=Pseudomonas koreensis TaxID=198620 RepID=UPI001B32234B|nr:hypothetical protein [Pseudomonas koreensis]MBP4001592.1 hypothetical protein [Pseudomonas koreensis]